MLPMKYVYLIISLCCVIFILVSNEEGVQLTAEAQDTEEELKEVAVYTLYPSMSISDVLGKLDPNYIAENGIHSLFGKLVPESFERLDDNRVADLCFSLITHDPTAKIYSSDFVSLREGIKLPDFLLKPDEFIVYHGSELYCYLEQENQKKMKKLMLSIMEDYVELVNIKRHTVEVSLIESDSEITLQTLDRSKTKEIFRTYQTILNPKYEKSLSKPQIDFYYVLESGEEVHIEATFPQVGKNLLVPVSLKSGEFLYVHYVFHSSILDRGFNPDEYYFQMPYLESEQKDFMSKRPLRTFKFRVPGDVFYRNRVGQVSEVAALPEVISKKHQLPQGAVGFNLDFFFESIGVDPSKGEYIYFCATTNEVLCHIGYLNQDHIEMIFNDIMCGGPTSLTHLIEFIEIPLPEASTPLDQIDYSTYKVLDGFDLMGRPGEDTIYTNIHSLVNKTVFTTTIGEGSDRDLVFSEVDFSYRDLSYSPELKLYYLLDQSYFFPLMKPPNEKTLIALKLISKREDFE